MGVICYPTQRMYAVMNAKMLITSDIHGNLFLINKLIKCARSHDINTIIICRDILPKGVFRDFRKGNANIYTSIFGIPHNLVSTNREKTYKNFITLGLFSTHFLKNIKFNVIFSYILELLSEFDIYIIQGNDDGINTDVWKRTIDEFSHVIDVNKNSYLIFEEYQLVGFNNILLTPWNTKFEIDENCMALELNTLSELIDTNKKLILITHGPPFGYGDKLPNGFRVGSKSLLKFIKKHQPYFHFYGHIHEAFGIYKIINTVSANVSCLWNTYGWDSPFTDNPSKIAQFRALLLDLSKEKCMKLTDDITEDDVNRYIDTKYIRNYYDLVINCDQSH